MSENVLIYMNIKWMRLRNLVKRCNSKIKKIRSDLRISELELSKKLGLGQSLISKIENNIQPVSSELIVEISFIKITI